MKRSEFESLLFMEVADRAAVEPVPPAGNGKYHGRPWLQLRDEMVASGAKSVHELRPDRIAAYYHLTKSAETGVLTSLRRWFDGSD